MGENILKELSDEEYQEWRQLWLAIISFDRYVFLANHYGNHSYLTMPLQLGSNFPRTTPAHQGKYFQRSHSQGKRHTNIHPHLIITCYQDPNFRTTLTDTIQNNITNLSIISGNILRDMYFSEQPSLNICRQYKTELEKWVASLPSHVQQYIQSGEVPKSPKDQAESIVS